MPVYDAWERSAFLGRDVRLYTFFRGTRTWRFNSSDRDVFYDGHVYDQHAIQDDGIKQKNEISADDFTVTVPISNPIALMFRGTPPSEPIRLQVRQVQWGDTEAPLTWVGFVTSVRLSRDGITCEIIGNTQVAYLSRKGLRLSYERSCPHVLYDDDCGVDKNAWGEAGTVRAGTLTGNAFYIDLEVDPPPGTYSGRFTNGIVEWNPQEGLLETRAIQLHDQQHIILLNNTDGMQEGMRVSLFPGCRRTPANCKLFHNIRNYGGFPMMPGKSPFDGDPVF